MANKNKDDEETEKKAEHKPIIIRNTTDLQRLKLEKLMKNPTKQIMIPERPKEKGIPAVPDFVRNVMGSSAGAGSGEFHVYRHLRRKEYARQRYMKEKGERERLEDEYHSKLEANKTQADKKTAKKRQKRLKRKMALKQKSKKPKIENESSESSSSSEESEKEISDEVEVKPTEDCNRPQDPLVELGCEERPTEDSCETKPTENSQPVESSEQLSEVKNEVQLIEVRSKVGYNHSADSSTELHEDSNKAHHQLAEDSCEVEPAENNQPIESSKRLSEDKSKVQPIEASSKLEYNQPVYSSTQQNDVKLTELLENS